MLETIAWVAYAVPVLVLFLWPARTTRAAPVPSAEPTPVSEKTAEPAPDAAG